jgi:hypothetical protein
MNSATSGTLLDRFVSGLICRGEPIRVTFDSNTLDQMVRPDRFPKDPRRAHFKKINRSLRRGYVRDFFSETILTLEGIQKIDRATVFGRTTILTSVKESKSSTGETITLTVTQPDRKPIHPEVARRVKAALQLGLRGLRIPRNGLIGIEDPHRKFFAEETEPEVALRQKKTFEAGREIEKRDLGVKRVKNIAARDNVSNELWPRSLIRARDVHEEGEVKRAVAEWSDADTISAHIGYGNEYFCTEDRGKTGGTASIFDEQNRKWLSDTYAVQFVTIEALSQKLRWCGRPK